MSKYHLVEMDIDGKSDGDIIEPTSEEPCIVHENEMVCTHGFNKEECLGHYKNYCIATLVAFGRLKPIE